MMSYYPSLPAPAHLEHWFRAFPRGVRPLLALHDALLRNADSPFSIGERELIAAYVSGLNACAFCFGAHKAMARAFGVDGALIDALMTDFDAAPAPERLKPVLAYARKLTQSPASVGPADVDAVLAAGWPEEAVADAAMITALYNFMNRVVDGAGLTVKESFADPTPAELEARRNSTYAGWGDAAGLFADKG